MMLQHERGYYSPRWADEPTVRGRRIVEAPATIAEQRRIERERRTAEIRRDLRECPNHNLILTTPTCPRCGAACAAVPPNDHGNTVLVSGLFRALVLPEQGRLF